MERPDWETAIQKPLCSLPGRLWQCDGRFFELLRRVRARVQAALFPPQGFLL